MTRLLQSAGSAVKALTNHISSDRKGGIASIDEQKTSFAAATARYFSLLSSVDVRLRRQIHAAEEAELIPTESTSKESQAYQPVPKTLTGSAAVQGSGPVDQVKERSGVSGNGLGNLDIGWLNSRNDKVGKEMEAELWTKAQLLVEMLSENGGAVPYLEEADIHTDGTGLDAEDTKAAGTVDARRGSIHIALS